MKNEISNERIEEIINKLNEDVLFNVYLFEITQDEQEALINTLINKKDAKLSADIIYHLQPANSSVEERQKFTAKEIEQLKNIILETNDADIACSVILNLPQNFTEQEKNKLRTLAVKTKNEYYAYNLYKKDCHFLNKNKEARLALRKVVMWTQNPERAFEFLERQEENLIPYEEDLKSLEYSNEELERFKQVIISSRDPKWSCKLLTMKETQKWREENASEYDNFDGYGYEDPNAVVNLTPNERTALKRNIIESHNPWYAYDAFRTISDLSEGERMILKGIIMQTEDINLACYLLCDTNFIPNISPDERSYLKKLAVQIKDKYNAKEALTYIYDLSPDERKKLESI